MQRRVVITGMGAITPVGIDVESSWSNIVQGIHGINKITAFDSTKSKVKVAAEVTDLDESIHFTGKQKKRLDRYAKLGIIAAREAYKDSMLDTKPIIDSNRIGITIGTGVGGMNTILEEHSNYLNGGSNYISPLLVPKFIPNILSGNLAIEFGINGMVNTVITACAASSNAIGDAYRSIKHGYLDVVMAGGSESCINPVMLGGFANLNAVTESDNIDRASIPFDKERNGFVMGEGAGILILEDLEHAQNRGAKIYAEIVGYGTTCDAYHLTAPDKKGIQIKRAMENSLNDAGISHQDIDYINAHGTSTPYNDLIETNAIKDLFKDKAKLIPISSTKSMVGHLLGAAGALEAICCIKTINDNIIHPTVGYTVSDENCNLDYVIDGHREKNVKYAMSNSFGFGGHNTVLIFKEFK